MTKDIPSGETAATRASSSILGGLALAGALLAGAALADGTQTGVITGTVLDDAGTPVQGVTVSLSGPQLDRQAVTDDHGRFRFPALGVGGYRVTAELLGLRSPAREVAVSINKTSELELRLRQPEGEPPPVPEEREWIRAVAEAPVIDRYETRVGANVSFDFLEQLPVRRFYQSVALLLPGVTGGEDGNPETSGALRSSNLYLVDGVDTTDSTTGLFGLNLAYEAVKEVEVTTAAAPAEYGRSSGAIINVVTRSGTQEFRGLARWVVTNNDWNDDYDYPRAVAGHLRPEIEAANAGPDHLDSTVALALGGPIARDRLFVSAAWENGERSFLRPTAFGELWDGSAEVESGAFKLTAQPSAAHTLVAQHTFDSARFTTFSPFDVLPAENRLPEIPPGSFGTPALEQRPGEIFALEDRTQDGSFTQLGWSVVAGQNLSLALNVADQERELERRPRNSRGLTADAPHVARVVFVDDGARFEEFFFLNGITEEGFERRPREQANLSADYFRGAGGVDHELTFGVDYQETTSETVLDVPGVDGVDRLTGRPVAGQLFIDFDPACRVEDGCFAFDPSTGEFRPFALFNYWRRPPVETREEHLAVYVSDAVSLRRWLIRLGLRYEQASGEGRRGDLFDDDGLAPRLAVSFDPRADGKVLLQAAWGRYYEPVLQQVLDFRGLVEPISGLTEYVWGARLDEPIAACRDADPTVVDHPCWLPAGVVAPAPLQVLPVDRELERAAVDELVIGFERQLSPSAGISLHWIDRRWSRLWDGVIRVSETGGLETAEITRLPGARRSYEALQLLFQRRYAERWRLLASYTWSRAEGNFFNADGFGTFGDFAPLTDVQTVNRFGPAPYDRPHQLRVYGSYLLPFERVGLSLAGALRYSDGVPYQVEVFENLGDGIVARRFVTPRGSERLSGFVLLDAAVHLDLPLMRDVELELKAEVFNVTGEQQQLGAESRAGSGLFGRARSLGDLLAPRSYRLTLGLRF